MQPEVGVLYEGLAANGAHVGFLARVRAVVRVERRLVPEPAREPPLKTVLTILERFSSFLKLKTIVSVK